MTASSTTPFVGRRVRLTINRNVVGWVGDKFIVKDVVPAGTEGFASAPRNEGFNGWTLTFTADDGRAVHGVRPADLTRLVG